jgi:hypothetical protein
MKQGFLQALAVGLYITLVGLFMWNANNIMGKMDGFWSPILALLLFSTSALICGLIVFLKPYKLFFADKKKEALTVVVSTTVWLFVFLLVFLLSLFFLK